MLTWTETTTSKKIMSGNDVKLEDSVTTIDLAFDADIFVVPNSLSDIEGSYHNVKGFLQECRLISDSKELPMPMSDGRTVQLWFVAKEDLGSDNLIDHGASIDFPESNDRLYLRPSFLLGNLPIDLFKDKKEGDVITIRVPSEIRNPGDTITISMRLWQKDYRYRQFGTFDECLNNLIEAYDNYKKGE